jgi:arylsulfatase A-like enzyme
MTKSTFFCIAILVAASVVAAAERPNFLFVYTDDQRYDEFGAVQREQGDKARFPWFETPNMDRLAREGVRFRNTFATCSLCAPSRAAFLTGRYNHCNGIASNFRPLPLDTVSHASILRQSGYTTGYVGKWHMGGQKECPGFDFQATLIGHGRYVDCPLIVNGVETPTTGWVDDATTGYAIDFLKQQKDKDKPWLMVVGFKAPHGPCTPPERAEKRFENEKARIVPNLDVQPIYLSKLGVSPRKGPQPENGLIPAPVNHLRCVSAADDNLGRLLDTLDQLGYTENTVVVFASDNGFYLGEHNTGDKRSAYEESLRIPFIVRYPKAGETAKGKVVDEPILNIDLAPSFLDLAGVPIPKEIQGKSWRQFLEGKHPADWRTTWFYEYFAENQNGTRIVDITAVRSLHTKLIRYSNKDGRLEDWSELFDLDKDPYEITNLYDNPAYRQQREQLEKEYDILYKEVGYRIPDYVVRPPWWKDGFPPKEGTPEAQAVQQKRVEKRKRKNADNP